MNHEKCASSEDPHYQLKEVTQMTKVATQTMLLHDRTIIPTRKHIKTDYEYSTLIDQQLYQQQYNSSYPENVRVPLKLNQIDTTVPNFKFYVRYIAPFTTSSITSNPSGKRKILFGLGMNCSYANSKHGDTTVSRFLNTFKRDYDTLYMFNILPIRATKSTVMNEVIETMDSPALDLILMNNYSQIVDYTKGFNSPDVVAFSGNLKNPKLIDEYQRIITLFKNQHADIRVFGKNNNGSPLHLNPLGKPAKKISELVKKIQDPVEDFGFKDLPKL